LRAVQVPVSRLAKENEEPWREDRAAGPAQAGPSDDDDEDDGATAAVSAPPLPPPALAPARLPPARRRTTALPPPLQGPSPFALTGAPGISYSSNRADVDLGQLVALLRTAAAAEQLDAAPPPWAQPDVASGVPPRAPHWFDADERGESGRGCGGREGER